jgi:vacuolar-type H+-ATPase subunit E/Vma4
MSEEKLDTQLIEKTIEQRNEVLKEAEAKAERILKNAEEERQRIMEQNNNAIQSVIGSELKAVHERIVGQSQLEGRKKVLEARHEVLSIVKDYALEELKLVAKRENPDYNYDEILINLVLEAIDAIDENNYVISANEGDTPFLRENIEKLVEKSNGKQIEVSENPIDAIGGIFVSNIARNKSMENTLDIRLENASEALQSDIAKKLGVI